MKKYYTLLIFNLICFSTLYSQDIPFQEEHFPNKTEELKKAVDEIKKGDVFFNERNYNDALTHFLAAQQVNANNADLNCKIGICYLYTLHKRKSLSFLEKAYVLNPKVTPLILYYLGWSHHVNENWDKAISFYSKQKEVFESSRKAKKENEKTIKKLEKKIQECIYGKQFVLHPVVVKIENLGKNINTVYQEHWVVIDADESQLMFSSQRPDSIGEFEQQKKGQPVVDQQNVYVSNRIDTIWQLAENIGGPVNTTHNDEIIALAPDGHAMLIYRVIDGNGDILESHLEGKEWSVPIKISSTINSQYNESSASFSHDGHSLYFISNNPVNNIGGDDIFVSQWNPKTEKWGVAENLGAQINTKYNEQSVFAHPDGKTLYFSSRGHNSMGGTDVFKTVWDKKTNSWSKPINMGYPINDAEDNNGLVVSANGVHGYFSAHRKDSYGDDDIYRVTFAAPKQERLTIVKGRVTDCETNQAIYARVDLVDLTADSVVSFFETNSYTGQYLVTLPAGDNYAITITDDEHLFHTEEVDIPMTATYHKVTHDFCLNKIDVSDLHTIKVGDKLVLKNVFFDSDESTLRPASIDELNVVFEYMNQNENLKLEFSGHTDNIGSVEYNQNLSERRAHAVVDFLIDRGIDEERLTYVGYGDQKPIMPNRTAEGRQKNRRTEMKILEK